MKRLNVLHVLSLAGLGFLTAGSASAQEGGYPYGGISIGQSRADIDEERITANLLAAGLTTTAMKREESDTAYKLFGGYQFNRNFALEGGYFNLGNFGFTSTTAPAGSLSGDIRLRGFNLDLVGALPLTERWSAIARAGAQYATARDTFRGSGAAIVLDPKRSKHQTNYKAGVGLQYAFSPSVLIRGEAERYRINDAVGNRGDVNLFSVSLVLPFGRAPVSQPRAMEAPTYTPPASAPVVVAASPAAPIPAPPARRRVSFSADSLFTFDQSTIRAEGMAELDKLAEELASTRFEMVIVEGHTDRLGSQAYNQTLSSQRAEAVKAYLVTSGGVNAAKVSAIGKSESAPVTKLEDCPGSKRTASLIACLQPDRRVEVEVAGTRGD